MARRRPGRLLSMLGALLILVGLVGAVALVLAGGERRSNAVAGFARAPVGCDTTLDFAEPGDYYVFVERTGSISGVRGDCDVDESYDASGDLDAEIVVVDPDGSAVDLDRPLDSVTYDVDGFVGEAVSVLDITDAGDHVMRVESPDGPFVAAVGPDPTAGVASLYAGAAIAALLGLLVGGALIVAGRRRGRQAAPPPQPTFAPAPFTPVGQAPQGPPTYAQPGGPVSYGQPQPQPQPAWQAAPQQPPAAPAAWNGMPEQPGAPAWQPAPPAPGTPAPPAQPTIAPHAPAPQPSAPQAPQPPPPAAAPQPAWSPEAPAAPSAPVVPQIPGEPSWASPGDQPAAPVVVPVPPRTDERPDLWADAPVAAPGPPDDATIRIDPATRPAAANPTDERDDSTIERPAWGDTPPPPT